MSKIIQHWLAKLPPAYAASLLVDVIARYADPLPPDVSLRFLFEIDRRLYKLQGQTSIKYDGGIHTKHRHMRYHDFFVGRIRAGERVLDIGCGMGAVAHDVAEKSGAYVTGIDLSAESIQQARSCHSHPRV
ncbi:MAG: methyltransferase domain-containing protein, partial [Anaerolineae bacterium]